MTDLVPRKVYFVPQIHHVTIDKAFRHPGIARETCLSFKVAFFETELRFDYCLTLPLLQMGETQRRRY